MTLKSAPIIAIFTLLSGAPLTALAQTDRPQVEQIPRRHGEQAVDQIPRASSRAALQPQLSSPGAPGNPQPKQITKPGAPPGAAAQLSGRDRNPRLAKIPPQMVDACEGPAAGRPPPDAVDCAAILEAAAFAAQPKPSAEQTLLGDPSENVQRGEASRAALGRTADADVIAARLASGDVQGSPIAQALASGSAQAAADSATPPQANGQVIITGPSGAIVVTPGRGR